MNEPLLRATTPLGYDAVVNQANWERHVWRRPELRDRLADLASVLVQPETIVRTPDGCDHYYRAGLWTDYPHLFLHVLVRGFIFGDDLEHVVVSAWFTRLIEHGEVLWQEK